MNAHPTEMVKLFLHSGQFEFDFSNFLKREREIYEITGKVTCKQPY